MSRSTPERFVVPAADGTYTRLIKRNAIRSSHCLALSIRSSVSAGTATISARAPGSTVFEAIADAAIGLTALKTVLMTFPVAEYQVVVSGMSGSSADNQITFTDTPLEI